MLSHIYQHKLQYVLCLLCAFYFSLSSAEKIDHQHEPDSAKAISQIPVNRSPLGFFFRGDSRPPMTADHQGIFDTGFLPQGTNTDLQAHLSFRGDSAYISTSRSDITAQRYMFGRTGQHQHEGFLYVIAPDALPAGYWIPRIYPQDTAVQFNQEFAVYGPITPDNIAGAFHYTQSEDEPIEWLPNPHYQYMRSSPYNPSTDGYFQDICGAVAVIAAYLCFKH